MTWLKNNLWAVILGVFGGSQVTLLILKWIGVIQWNSVLVLLQTLILVALTLSLVGFVLLLDLDDLED